jgi:soluble lytic murein transglycosylase-like protein
MYELLKTNKKYLRKYIEKYDGEVVHGVLVTESGLLAAAHLGGAGSVKKWFRTGKVRKDGNGVKITNYMEKFSGYKLDLN